MKIFTLKIRVLFALVICSVGVINAQSYDLQFVEVNNDEVNGGNYDVKIQLKASGSSFNLGLSNLVFNFNTNGLYSNHAPDDGTNAATLLSTHNFNSGGYSAMDITEPQSGILSLNINYNFESSGNGTNVGTSSWMDVATIRFTIKERTQTTDFSWRDDQVSGGLNPVVVYNDAVPANPISRGSTNSSNVPLPVELALFTAETKTEGVVLNWITQMEANNDRFEIQRSVDATNWNMIGSRDGKGNTLKTVDYSYTDKEALQLPVNDLFYRLKQVDFDGRFEYSNVVRVHMLNSDFPQVSVFPNPFRGELNIQGVAENANITLVNVQGQKVLQTNASTASFNQLDNLTPGTYMLLIQNGANVQKIKVQKQ